MTKKAIIIGISGQDGVYLSRLLRTKGYEVIGLTSDKGRLNLKNLQFLYLQDVLVHEVDLLNSEAMLRFFQEQTPDEVYNLAAQSSVGLSFNIPFQTIQFNIMSVLNILEGIRESSKPVRYYQASSSEMFGNIHENDLPVNETYYFQPASPYGISKAAGHWLTVNYRDVYHMFCACGVLFNHESCLRGNNFVSKKIITSAIGIKEGFTSDKLVLGDLGIIRDWGYAPEYVEAMWLMLQKEKPSDYLVCTACPMSLKDFVIYAFDSLGLDWEEHVRIDQSLFRPKELKKMYGDNSKCKNELGWERKLFGKTLVEQLIQDEYEYIKFTNESSTFHQEA